MTRILFGGDSAATGFGTVTIELGKRLLALGHDVRFVSMNEQPEDISQPPFAGRTAVMGQPSGWLGMEDPGMTATRLEGMFKGTLFEDGWTPEAAIILGDPASLKMSPILNFVPPSFPAFHYCPVEGVGLPPRWGRIWERIRPVAVTESGAREIARVTGTMPPVIYHGIDTETFHPATAAKPIVLWKTDGTPEKIRSRAQARKVLGWPPDDVIIFRHDRHVPRKNYPAALRIAASVLDRHANARFVWHCAPIDQGGDLMDERSKYHERIASRMNSTGFYERREGVTPRGLALMLNAADLYMSTSSEGFGLCVAEALACGIPAIGLDYSSLPEVIGPAGLLAPAYIVDNVYSYFWGMPKEPEYAALLDRLVGDARERELLGSKGPAHVREHFTWDKAAAQFSDLITAAVPQEAAA